MAFGLRVNLMFREPGASFETHGASRNQSGLAEARSGINRFHSLTDFDLFRGVHYSSEPPGK
jgi:hypothetical protein